MSLSVVKDWICEFLHSPCATPSRFKVLKPFYNTYCFIHKTICNVDDSGANIHEINFAENSFVRTESKCYLSHYFSDVVGKICSSSCNITVMHLEVPVKDQLNDNSCSIADYLKIWLKETSNKAFTQVSCKELKGEASCFLDWCEIYDYTKFWWSELYKKWCYLVDCVKQQTMKLNPETGAVLIPKEQPQQETWIRNWISHNLGIQWPRNVSLFQFLVFFCTIGGMGLFFLLLYRKRLKPRTESTSLKLEDIDAKLVQALFDVLTKNESDNDNLKKVLEDSKLESSQTIQNLSNQNEIFRQQISKLVAEHLRKQEEIKNHASNLELKCKEYENQVCTLKQHLQDLQKDHSIKIETFLRENRKTHQVEQIEDELEIPRQLHQNEVSKLTDNSQFQRNNEINKQTHRGDQHNLNQLHVDDVCVRQSGSSAGLNKKTEHSQENHSECQRSAQKGEEEEDVIHEDDSNVIESLQTIAVIFEQVRKLKVQIEEFSGTAEDKIYLHLNELLIRNTLTLDNIESNGRFVIRRRRKEVLDYIHNCRNVLKSKVID